MPELATAYLGCGALALSILATNLIRVNRLLLDLSYPAGRGLQPRLKRLDVLIVLET